MTKPKCLVWNYFTPALDKRTGKRRYKCKFCDSLYQKNATRQEKHLLKCEGFPGAVKSLLLNKGEVYRREEPNETEGNLKQ